MEKGNHIRVKKLTTYGMQRKKLTIGKIYQILDKNLYSNEIYVIDDIGNKIGIAVYDYSDLELLPQDDQHDFSLNIYEVLMDELIRTKDFDGCIELHRKLEGIKSK